MQPQGDTMNMVKWKGKLNIVVLYYPPAPLGYFLNEQDTLLSSLPEDGIPVILLGDINLPPESSVFQSFALTLSSSPATHKAGNQLDLVFTRSCSTPQLRFMCLIITMFTSLSYPPIHSLAYCNFQEESPHSLSFLSHLFYTLYTPLASFSILPEFVLLFHVKMKKVYCPRFAQ